MKDQNKLINYFNDTMRFLKRWIIIRGILLIVLIANQIRYFTINSLSTFIIGEIFNLFVLLYTMYYFSKDIEKYRSYKASLKLLKEANSLDLEDE